MKAKHICLEINEVYDYIAKLLRIIRFNYCTNCVKHTNLIMSIKFVLSFKYIKSTLHTSPLRHYN